MLTLSLKTDIGKTVVYLICEPTDLKKLPQGKPFRSDADRHIPEANIDIFLGYVPDMKRFLAEIQAKKMKCAIDNPDKAGPSIQVKDLLELLDNAQRFPEIYR